MPINATTTGVSVATRASASRRWEAVSVGGVDSAEAAYARVRAGASLVQLYTGLVYEGPGVVRRIHRGLVRCLDRDGLPTLADAVGLDA